MGCIRADSAVEIDNEEVDCDVNDVDDDVRVEAQQRAHRGLPWHDAP